MSTAVNKIYIKNDFDISFRAINSNMAARHVTRFGRSTPGGPQVAL